MAETRLLYTPLRRGAEQRPRELARRMRRFLVSPISYSELDASRAGDPGCSESETSTAHGDTPHTGHLDPARLRNTQLRFGGRCMRGKRGTTPRISSFVRLYVL